jgi:thiamine pyrophosphate-dependent acetolactate synthase large subunit-like protein
LVTSRAYRASQAEHQPRQDPRECARSCAGAARLTEAYGLCGIPVERGDGLDAAIADAWDHDGSPVIDFRVEREVNVFPLVPPGGSIGEMMTDPLTH